MEIKIANSILLSNLLQMTSLLILHLSALEALTTLKKKVTSPFEL